MTHFIRLIDADGLCTLSERRDADEQLHWLVASLLLKSGVLIEPPEVRTGTGMQYGGWDGRSEALQGSLYVPEGDTCWEMSKRKDVAAKAEDDYVARTSRIDPEIAAETTIILVTLRRWSNKNAWRERKKTENVWKDVRVYDADDLYIWIQGYQTVHTELTQRAWGVFEGVSTNTVKPRQDSLPGPLKDFVGREQQIKEFRDAFDARPSDATFSYVISGLPGSGKTSLALTLSAELDGDFPDGRLFFDLRGTQDDQLDTKTVQLAVLRAFGAVEGLLDDPESIDGAYRTVISDRRILLVLDNARDEAHARPLLLNARGSAVILTSRNKLLGLDATLFNRLGVFDEDDSVLLLSKLCASGSFDLSLARKVATLCGNLPLAVRIAGVLAAQTPGWGLTHLVDNLTDENLRLGSLEVGDRAVRASFELSYRQLSQVAKRCLALCSDIPGPHWDVELASKALDADLTVTRQQLRVLTERNLIQHAEMPGEYQFHDLLRVFSRTTEFGKGSSQERMHATGRVVSHIVETATAHGSALSSSYLVPSLPKGGIKSSGWQAALKYLDLRIENIAKAIPSPGSFGSSHDVVMLVAALDAYFRLRPITLDSVQIAEAGLKAASAMRNQALERINLDSEIVRSTGEWRVTMLLLHADVLSRVGRNDEALKSIQRAKSLVRSLNDVRLSINAYTSAGQLAYRQGRIKDALAEYNAASELSATIVDYELRSLVGYNVGNMLRQTGDPSKSLQFLEDDLSVCINRGDALGEATARNALGIALTRVEKTDKAILHLRKAVEIYSELDDLQRASDARFDLGSALLGAGAHVEGMALLEQDEAYCRHSGNELGAAIAHLSIISVRVQLDPDTASANLADLQASLLKIRSLGNLTEIASALASTSKVQFAAGLVDNGLESALEASQLLVRAGDSWQQAAVLIQSAEDIFESSTGTGKASDILIASEKVISLLETAIASLADDQATDLYKQAQAYLDFCYAITSTEKSFGA